MDAERIVVLGCGSVGAAVADRLRAEGRHVTGTTTTIERLDVVRSHCDSAAVVRGGNRDEVETVVAPSDAVVVCVSPPEGRSATAEGRLEVYRQALVATAGSVGAVAGSRPVLAISSLSVLGACLGLESVTEETPLPDLADPSPRGYREMEQSYLAALPRSVTLLRTGDIVSPGDPLLQAKVALAHQYLGGEVPFDERSLAYRLPASEIAEVVVAVLAAGAQGVLHVVSDEVPPTNGELYGRACDEAGLPPLVFRRELATPTVPVRADRLAALGLHLRAPAD